MSKAAESPVNDNPFNEVWKNRPLNKKCGREITIDIVADRCIYINNHRVQGDKPYHSENLPTKTKKVSVRDIMDAFSETEIRAYLKEKKDLKKYFADYHAANHQSEG